MDGLLCKQKSVPLKIVGLVKEYRHLKATIP